MNIRQVVDPSDIVGRVDSVDARLGASRVAKLLETTAIVARQVASRAPAVDRADAFPSQDIETLANAGLLAAPLPVACGGDGLVTDPALAPALARVLMMVGEASLPLGRLYEGHVNALKLIHAYARAEQTEAFAKLVCAGRLFAVWNTQVSDGVELVRSGAGYQLRGRKVFASGAGNVTYPLITARREDGLSVMVIPTVDDHSRSDLSGWDAHGMRPSFSGAVDFTGIAIGEHQIIGDADDFLAQPMFSAGAWRFAAVQTGGIAAVFSAARAHLAATGRIDDPYQKARMGSAALSLETARLWVANAARIADDETIDGDTRVAYVNLTRTAVERAGLDVLELAQRCVGLAGLQRAHPLERLTRDLTTYLRQPNPDKALADAGLFTLRQSGPVLDTWSWP